MLSMLFTHFADRRPISTFTPLFFVLTPTAWYVSKFSWFPSLLSWRRRNFLGKHSTFLATRELLVQLKSASFSLVSVPFSLPLLTNNLLSGTEPGFELWIVHSIEKFCWIGPELYGDQACTECSCWMSHKGKKGLFPPAWTSVWERGQILLWADTGVSASEEIQLPEPASQQARRGKCPLIQGGSCQNKHTGDSVSQLIFSLLFLHCLFPTSPSEAFPELYMPAATQTPLFQTQNIYDVDEWENMTDRFKTWRFVIMAVWNPVLHF